MSVTINEAMSKIAIAKNLVKEYHTPEHGRTVYLNDKTEFQIYIKNPYSWHLGIDIYINEVFVGNRIVLKPGQTVWLERFLDTNNKFLFSTYEVEDTPETKYAIRNNGGIKLEFYREDTNTTTFNNTLVNDDWNNVYWNLKDNNLFTSTKLTCEYPANLFCSVDNPNYKVEVNNKTNYTCSAASTIDLTPNNVYSKSNKNIETGRIEKGSKSNQKFDTCSIKFGWYPFETEHIQILPNSRKQIGANELRRKYCSSCGVKVKPDDKYCYNCGKKLK